MFGRKDQTFIDSRSQQLTVTSQEQLCHCVGAAEGPEGTGRAQGSFLLPLTKNIAGFLLYFNHQINVFMVNHQEEVVVLFLTAISLADM